jgi:WD40 repeat protein
VDATMIPTSHHAQDSISRAMTALPTEEELATSTLWPEIEKVYGHGYEVSFYCVIHGRSPKLTSQLVSMAASHSGHLLATSCRATTAEHAVVRLVSTSSWDTVAILPGHTLTVTRIQFSPDDRYILTCSRDRGWRVFGRIEGEEGKENGGWEMVAGEEKAHARMVLDACCLKRSGGFATASRDKTVSSC